VFEFCERFLREKTDYGKDFGILWDLGISGKITECDCGRTYLDITNLCGK